MSNDTLTPHSIWRHYKGNQYELVGIARHSETLEEMIVYRALYGEGGLWARPRAMWLESVQTPSGTVQRFTKIKEGDANVDA